MTVRENELQCQMCEDILPLTEFMPSKSPFWAKKHINICYDCVGSLVDYRDLNQVDRLLQFANIAFEPNEWIKIYNRVPEGEVFRQYAAITQHKNYIKMDWGEQNQLLIESAKVGTVNAKFDDLAPEFFRAMRRKWGNFTDDELVFLEEFYNGMINDYAVQSKTDKDLLKKFAIVSLGYEKQLMEGESIDKNLMTAYQNLLSTIKKDIETENDQLITSIGEVIEFIEREGYEPKFYDGISRDEADRIIEDNQDFLRNLIGGAVNLQSTYEATAMKYNNRELGDD